MAYKRKYPVMIQTGPVSGTCPKCKAAVTINFEKSRELKDDFWRTPLLVGRGDCPECGVTVTNRYRKGTYIWFTTADWETLMAFELPPGI